MLDESGAVRRSRPSNRKELIAAAAGRLFYEDGFDHVSMGDIASAVDVGASALYRHFTNKQTILRQVLHDGLGPLIDLMRTASSESSEALARELASAALDERPLGLLILREARHLDREDAVEVRRMLHVLSAATRAQLVRVRPALSPAQAEVMAHMVLSVLASPSFHRVQMPRPAFEGVIADAVRTVIDADLRPVESTSPAPPLPIAPSSRREAILDAAVLLFARRGYTNVGVEDIGAAVGIAGPSVYNHFSSKNDILVTAMRRGSAVLFMDLASILRSSVSADAAVRRLVRSYACFAGQHPAIVIVMGADVQHLDDDDRLGLRRLQHEYVDEWVQLMRKARPELSGDVARVRIQAVLTIINDVAQFDQGAGSARSAVVEVCSRVLTL